MMRVARWQWGLLVLISVARTAASQDVPVLGTDREASAELAKIVAAAKENGLPVDPILAKVRYGVMMHAPAPRIVAAAHAVATRLEDARSALAPQPTAKDIAAGENALGSDVSRKSLQEIRKVSPNRPVAVPLGVLAQLVANKVPEKKAVKYVTDLIKHGATDQQVADLGNDVNTDVKLGGAGLNALELRMNRLNAVLGAPGGNADAASVPTSLQSGDGKKKP
jgi:hypothetical protein